MDDFDSIERKRITKRNIFIIMLSIILIVLIIIIYLNVNKQEKNENSNIINELYDKNANLKELLSNISFEDYYLQYLDLKLESQIIEKNESDFIRQSNYLLGVNYEEIPCGEIFIDNNKKLKYVFDIDCENENTEEIPWSSIQYDMLNRIEIINQNVKENVTIFLIDMYYDIDIQGIYFVTENNSIYFQSGEDKPIKILDGKNHSNIESIMLILDNYSQDPEYSTYRIAVKLSDQNDYYTIKYYEDIKQYHLLKLQDLYKEESFYPFIRFGNNKVFSHFGINLERKIMIDYKHNFNQNEEIFFTDKYTNKEVYVKEVIFHPNVLIIISDENDLYILKSKNFYKLSKIQKFSYSLDEESGEISNFNFKLADGQEFEFNSRK